MLLLTLFKIVGRGGGGGGGKNPPQKCPSLLPSFNLISTLVWIFKAIPSVNPQLLNLNQDHPSKKVVFLVKSL